VLICSEADTEGLVLGLVLICSEGDTELLILGLKEDPMLGLLLDDGAGLLSSDSFSGSFDGDTDADTDGLVLGLVLFCS
jgi:hypothetical protein